LSEAGALSQAQVELAAQGLGVSARTVWRLVACHLPWRPTPAVATFRRCTANLSTPSLRTFRWAVRAGPEAVHGPPYCKRVDDLDTRLNVVEQRNRRVDGDKAWETSFTRRALIMAFTYVIVLAYGFAIDASNPALNAVIPVAGFFLSTVTVPAIKRRWLARFRRDS
jgi:hypothetical protein